MPGVAGWSGNGRGAINWWGEGRSSDPFPGAIRWGNSLPVLAMGMLCGGGMDQVARA